MKEDPPPKRKVPTVSYYLASFLSEKTTPSFSAFEITPRAAAEKRPRLPTAIPWALRYSRVVVGVVICLILSRSFVIYIISEFRGFVNRVRKAIFLPVPLDYDRYVRIVHNGLTYLYLVVSSTSSIL